MRRVYVDRPSFTSRVELYRRRVNESSVEEARAAWKRYRGSAKSREVVSTLKSAAGKRVRCFYCSDSLAADVDHFIPISTETGKTFDWKNFVWVCPVCNRGKNDRFPVDDIGSALLINPTLEDPWKYLVLDSGTGVLAPRYVEDAYDIRGETTLRVLAPINFEPAIEGRARVIRHLREAIERIPSSSSSFGDELAYLRREVREDDYGVAAWFALWEGRSETDISNFRNRNYAAWKKFVIAAQLARYGHK